MKNYVIGLLILIVLAAGALVLLWSPDTKQQQTIPPFSPAGTETTQDIADLPEPPPGAIVFDMKYRGLSGEKDELRYNMFWGFGGYEKDTPFLGALRKKNELLHPLYNPQFCQAQRWSALEIKDNKAVAFYFDLDADGKVSANEKIPPVKRTEQVSAANRAEFVTPDFTMTTPDGLQVKFRVVLQATFYGNSSIPNCMWSPSCVLEGNSTIAGKPSKLILYTNGFSGSFTEFGRCSYSLLAVDSKSGQDVPRNTLSSLVNYNGQYYSMKLQGAHANGKTVRAVLEEYTGDTGKMAVKLAGNSGLEAKFSSANLAGTEDNNIRFSISGDQSVLPAEAYKLNSGDIDYGLDTADQRRVSITKGPEFKIKAGKTCYVELGKPTLSVRAIDEEQRYQTDAKEKSVFSDDTGVFLTPKIVGKAGELYGKFSRKNSGPYGYEDIEPKISIVDSNGKEVASATMEYG